MAGKRVSANCDGGGDLDRRWDDVVGGLSFVDVVVGVNGVTRTKFAAEGFDCHVGDDLVGVHVGGGARAGLEDVDHESVVELAFDDALGGGDDGTRPFGVEGFEFEIYFRGALLYLCNGADEGATEAQIADGEVEFGATGVCAIVGVCRDVQDAHGVAFGAEGVGHVVVFALALVVGVAFVVVFEGLLGGV